MDAFCLKPALPSPYYLQKQDSSFPCMFKYEMYFLHLSGKHLQTFEKGWVDASEGANKQKAIRTIKLPIFADGYLTIFAYHCLRGKNPAVRAKNETLVWYFWGFRPDMLY